MRILIQTFIEYLFRIINLLKNNSKTYSEHLSLVRSNTYFTYKIQIFFTRLNTDYSGDVIIILYTGTDRRVLYAFVYSLKKTVSSLFTLETIVCSILRYLHTGV